MSSPNLLHQHHQAESGSAHQASHHTHHADSDHHPKPKRRHWWLWLLLGVIVAIGLALAPLISSGVQAVFAVNRAKADLTDMRTRLAKGDIEGAQSAAARAQAELATIKRLLANLGAWRFLPWIGPQLGSLDSVSQTGALALDGAQNLLNAAQSLQSALISAGVLAQTDLGIEPSRSFQSLTPDEKRSILARLYNTLPDLRVARDKIDLAEQTFQTIPQDQLFAPLRSALAPLATQLPDLRLRLDHAVSLIEVFVPLLGYPNAKHYLVLLQNSDEIRPTGGFIGNVGILDVNAGDIRQFKFQDVYAIDNLVTGKLKDVPPDPLKRELGISTWFLRDSNWSPDFPQSAQRLMDVYQRSLTLAGATSTTPVDGVIALQPGFFQDLLNLTGPITIEGKTFTASNFFDELEYDVEVAFLQTGTPVAQRKEIVAKVGDAMVSQLTSQPASRWPDILETINRALSQKDMLMAVNDPALQKLLDAKNWSDRTQGAPQDYLWVVDANLAALKTDGVMDKQVKYSIDASDPNNIQATVTLTYTNTNRKIDWRYTRYRSYTRIYVPEGSQLISSAGAMLGDKTQTGGRVVPGQVDVTKDLGKTVFGAFWAIEPGQTGTLRFTYRLPSSVADGLASNQYKILVQKQPGANQRLTLDLLFGKNVVRALPAEDEKDFGDARYRLSEDLVSDQDFQIELAK